MGLTGFVLALLLTACSGPSFVTLPDPETSQEQTTSVIATASDGHSIGQTFLTRRPRLNGITLWVYPTSPVGKLQVELYHSPTDQIPLFTQTYPLSSIQGGILTIHLGSTRGSGFTRGSTPTAYGSTHVSTPTRGSTQQYYILLRPIGGTIQARGRPEDIYPAGQAYADQAPLQADLAFTTTYDYDLPALLTDLRLSLPRLWLVLPTFVTLFLPGWLLLDGSGLARRFDGGERVGLSVGLSLAIIPLTMLWSTTLGLRWGRTGLLVASGLLLAAMFWRLARNAGKYNIFWKNPTGYTQPQNLLQPSRKKTPQPLRRLRVVTRRHGVFISLLGIFLLTLVVRLVMTRDLAAPAWVDSIHHATITRLILEHGGFSSTYAPYIDINATEYHAGFHSSLAVFQWLSGLEEPDVMLLFGQVLNALIVFATYLLTVSLTRKRTAGLVAAVIAGLFTPMPAYYTSWGRYTQLTGLLILPAGLALARLVIETNRKTQIPGHTTSSGQKPLSLIPFPLQDRGKKFLTIFYASLVCGGLFLVHYRVAGFLALLFLAYFLSRIGFTRGENYRLVKNILAFCLGAGLLALLVTLPWSWQAITQVFAPKVALTGGSSARLFNGFFWEYLTAAWGLPAMLLGGLGLAISLFRRPSLTVSVMTWTGFLLLAGNLSALHLPGGWFINTISIAITLFMPTAVLGGYALGQVYDFLRSIIPPPWKLIYRWIAALLGLVVALLAARALLPILRPSTELFRLADRPAMDWIDKNIPASETILINPMYWGYGTYAGADGGYWITPLTGRKTIPPPVLYSLGSPSEKSRIQTICQTVLQKAGDPAALAQYLRGQNIHYVYLGVRGGSLSPLALQQSDLFQVLYTSQGAWVFAVR